MSKAVSLLLTIVLGVGGLLMAVVAFRRGALPYNSEGRYFDASDSVVYTDSAPVTFGALALILIAAALFIALWAARLSASGRCLNNETGNSALPAPVPRPTR